MTHYYRYLFVKMKVFNYSELHFSEVTSYKIPTLVSECSWVGGYDSLHVGWVGMVWS